MNLSTEHFLYTGIVKHRRYTPFNREFSYPIFMLYLDINDLNNVMKKSILWNVNKAAMVSFNRNDYHNAKTKSLDQAVRDTVQKKLDIDLAVKSECWPTSDILVIVLIL